MTTNMIKLIISILIAGLISCNLPSDSHKLDCSKFKDGVFHTKIDTPFYRGEITRKGDLQIEKDLTTGKSYPLKVRWINDCTYSLTYVPQEDTLMNYLKGRELIVEITKISGDTVFTQSHIPGINFKAEIKMIKVK